MKKVWTSHPKLRGRWCLPESKGCPEMDVKSAWEGIMDRKEDHENMAWGVKKDKSGNIGLKFAWDLDG